MDQAGDPHEPGKPRRTYPWETVHVFVSSTFNDMHGERDYLVKHVFPELRDWCEERKLRLVDIDLRWGVTETDATRNKNVVQVCLDRIDKARPFFICFLGQRYGWVPKEKEIAPKTFKDFAGLDEAVANYSSVTEMEVLHALLRKPFDKEPGMRLPADQAFFYMRTPAYLAKLPKEPTPLRRIYADAPETDPVRRRWLLNKRKHLRQRIREECGRPVRWYSARWNPEARTPELALPLQCPSSQPENCERWRQQWKEWGGVETTEEKVAAADEAKARDFDQRLCAGRLEDFWLEGRSLGEAIVEDLKAAILARYPERVELPEQDDLEGEIDRHEDFIRTATDVFIEREGDFAELDAYAAGDSRKLFVLVAKAGLGKSTLLANWVARWQGRAGKPPGETVHARFVGVGEHSNNVDSLLRSILEELRRAGKLASETPDNANVLRSKLGELLGECGKHGRTVVVIDALNQLQSGLSDLDWLPREPPKNVKLIISFKLGEEIGDTLAAQMRSDERVVVSEVQPFASLKHRRSLVAAFLGLYLKELDEQHLEALIRADGASNPLFLKVVLTELRVFGAFAQLGDVIKQQFGTTPVTAFTAVLSRLENDPSYSPIPSKQAVPLLFGLLAHSRGGLPNDLLVRMFLDELGFGEDRGDAMRSTIRLFLRQVRPFLARRDGREDFFYEAFQLAARRRYAEGAAETTSETPDGSLESGTTVPTSSLRRRLIGFWHKLLACVRATRPDTRQAVEPSAGMSIGPDPLSPPRWLRHQWHTRIARVCERWTELERVAKRYALGNLAYHEVEAGNGVAAAELMTAFGYHYERLRVLGPQDMVNTAADLLLAERAVGSASPLCDQLRVWKGFCSENAHQLRRPNRVPEASLLQLAVTHAETSPVAASAERWLEVTGSGGPWLRSLRRPHDFERSACLRTLEGQTGWVSAIALSSDGRRAVSGEDGTLMQAVYAAVLRRPAGRNDLGSEDGTLKLWDLATGQCLHVLCGHTGPVNAVALSSDGRRALSAGNDKLLRLWDVETGRHLRTLRGHTRGVNAVGLSSDGRRAISGSSDKSIRHWDVETGRCLRVLRSRTRCVNAVALSSDGCRAISGSDDGSVKLWDLHSGWCLHALHGHTRRVTAVALSSDGCRAVSGSDDGTVKLWDLDTGQCLRTIERGRDTMKAVAFSSDGRRALHGSYEVRLALWDLESGQQLEWQGKHVGPITAITVSSDGRRALSASLDRTLMLWDLETEPRQRTLLRHRQPVTAIGLCSDGRCAFSESKDESALWDLDTGEYLGGGRRYANSRWSGSSSDGQPVLSGHGNKTLEFRNFDVAAFSSDGRRAVSKGADKTVKVWDLDTGQCVYTLLGHTSEVTAVALSSDSRHAVSGSEDTTIRIWDLDTGQCVRTLVGHTSCVKAVAFSSDGRRAVSGAGGYIMSYDCTLRLWDLATGLCLATWQADDPVLCCGLGSDAIMAGTQRGDVLLLKLMPPGRIIPETTAATWHPSSPLLAVARANGSLLVQEWHPAAQQLEELARTASSGSPVERLQWSCDGAYLLVVARDGTERILDSGTLSEASDPVSAWAESRDVSADGAWCAVTREGQLVVEATSTKASS